MIERSERRLLLVGNIDTTFGAGGYGIVAGTELSFADLHVMDDDRIVAAASHATAGGKTSYGAVRWTANAALDTSFSGDGIVTTDLLPSGDNNDHSIPAKVDVAGN